MPVFCSACNIQMNAQPDPITHMKIFTETDKCDGCTKEYCKNNICNKQLKEFKFSKYCNNCLTNHNNYISNLGTCEICNLPYISVTMCNCTLKCTGKICPNNHNKFDDPNKKH